MNELVMLVLSLVGVPNEEGSAPASPDIVPKPAWTITASGTDRDLIPILEADLQAGRQRIETFFGRPFEKAFNVEVFPGRAEFDALFRKRWQVPRTERWMVACGVADKLAILTPRVWKSQAVEHDPGDRTHMKELLAHELVHVYHGQHNPTGDFEGMDDLGWFVEGLAVYVSGQLDHGQRDAARKAIAEGKAPTRLASAWSGKYRYGVCGSMVRFIDLRYGLRCSGSCCPKRSRTKPRSD
jgi:hypothetical protein